MSTSNDTQLLIGDDVTSNDSVVFDNDMAPGDIDRMRNEMNCPESDSQDANPNLPKVLF